MICKNCAQAADTGEMKLHERCNNYRMLALTLFLKPTWCYCQHMEKKDADSQGTEEIRESSS